MSKQHAQKNMAFKDVPKGTVFTDPQVNVYYKVAPMKSLAGEDISAVFVEASNPGASKLEAGDPVVLDQNLQVTVYN